MDQERAKLLAEKRVESALKALRLCGNLGRHSLSKDQRSKIQKTLKEATGVACSRLVEMESPAPDSFKL